MSGFSGLSPLPGEEHYSPDPFTRVERALWQILEDHQGFCDLVQPNNRIKFCYPYEPGQAQHSHEDPIKDRLASADLPEVMILPTTGEPNTHRTSAGPSMRQEYNLVITTGERRTWRKLNPVKWAVWVAFERRRDLVKEWCSFVHQVDTGTFSDGFEVGESPERGPRGWNSVMPIRVLMKFSMAELDL